MLSNFLSFFKFWGLEYISNSHLIMWGCNPLTSSELPLSLEHGAWVIEKVVSK